MGRAVCRAKMTDCETQDRQTRSEQADDMVFSGSSESTPNGEEEDIDPRIEVNLERLNSASEEVNRLERELSEARMDLHSTAIESGRRLTALRNSQKKAIERAKPYYQARQEARRAYVANQRAARRFEKATSMHKAAMEMVAVAEQNFVPHREVERPFDPTWIELLNQANDKFAESEKEKVAAQGEYQTSKEIFEEARQRVRAGENIETFN